MSNLFSKAMKRLMSPEAETVPVPATPGIQSLVLGVGDADADRPRAAIPDERLKSVILFGNGMVMVFGEDGRQLPGIGVGDNIEMLQGPGREVWATILSHADADTEFFLGDWQAAGGTNTPITQEAWLVKVRSAGLIKQPAVPSPHSPSQPYDPARSLTH